MRDKQAEVIAKGVTTALLRVVIAVSVGGFVGAFLGVLVRNERCDYSVELLQMGCLAEMASAEYIGAFAAIVIVAVAMLVDNSNKPPPKQD